MQGRKTALIVRMDHGTSHLLLSEPGFLGLSLDVRYAMCWRFSMGCNPTWSCWMYSPNPDPAAVVGACTLISRSTVKFYSFGISILLRIAGVLEMLSNLCRDLTIRHLVNRFHTHDASIEVVFLEPLLQFALGLTGSEYQNGIRITNTRNDRIVVDVELSRKPSLAAIICRYLL
jgi:hypothetical protein